MSVKAAIGRIFLLGIASTLLVLILVKPNWLAHLVATLLFFLFGNTILFYYGFHPKSNFIGRKTKFAHASERAQRNAQRVFRSIVIGFAFFLFYFCDIPAFQDCILLAKQGRPYLSEIKGTVHANNFNFGLYFLDQGILVIKEGESSGSSHSAMFFSRVARFDNTYWFLIAPKSGLVLDFQPVAESADPPTWK